MQTADPAPDLMLFVLAFACLQACAGSHDRGADAGPGSHDAGGGRFQSAGEACPAEGEANACALDKSTVLRCEQGQWTEIAHCLPASHCLRIPDDAAQQCHGYACYGCALSVGDPCDDEPDAVRCSADGKKVLQCKSGRMALRQECSGYRVCTVNGDVDGGFVLSCQLLML